jgi:predicted negative regulator of RcsB-dependent stress response
VDELLSEKEQIEKIRSWWSDYGYYVIGGIVLGASGLFGWSKYRSAELEEQYAASALYSELAEYVVEGRLDEAEAVAGRMEADHAESAYATQSRLALARLYMDKNRDQDAADVLSGLIASTAGDEFKHVARLRLAKILLYQDKAQEVVDLLAGQEEGAFAARYADTLGDAQLALGQIAEARAAYQRALAETGAGGMATVNQSFVQLKLVDLPIELAVATPDDAGTEAAEAEPEALEDDAEPVEEDVSADADDVAASAETDE